MIWDSVKALFGLLKVPEFDTASEPPVPPRWLPSGAWIDSDRRVDPHSYRTGGEAWPGVVVVHTTDMPPGTFEPLVKQWRTTPGKGACANFLIGRTPKEGVVEMTRVGRNGNHAGGPTHGNFVYEDRAKGTKLIHPNLVTVGIEVHTAGRLRWKTGSVFRVAQFVEDGKVKAEFSGRDVHVDEQNRPWHNATQYQLVCLAELLVDLKPRLTGTMFTVMPSGDWTANRVAFAKPELHQIIGHAGLDPVSKSDPGPQITTFMNATARSAGYV